MPSWFFFEKRGSLKVAEVIFVAAGLLLFAAPAKAGFQATGFQWVAPAEQTPSPQFSSPTNPSGSISGEAPPALAPAPAVPVVKSPSMAVTPLAGENPEIISPIVIEGQPLAPSSSQGQEQAFSLGALPASSDTIVQGFANNVPLAVALREILPPGYGFSIDQDVDLGTLVSFQGGKSWRETLQSMLAPSGLVMREQNEMVAIGRTQTGGATITAGEGVSGSPMSAPQALTSAPAASFVPPRMGSDLGGGPKPAWAQPSAKPMPVVAAPPPVSSSRMSSASVVDTWTAARGETLHKTLQTWSGRAGAEFEWLAEYDYPLQASISFTGTFEEAVRSLLSGFEDAHPQPVAELHANPGAGQMVLVIQTRGNSYTD